LIYNGVSRRRNGRGESGGTVNVRMTPVNDKNAEIGVN
jgi:hypothetical protein